MKRVYGLLFISLLAVSARAQGIRVIDGGFSAQAVSLHFGIPSQGHYVEGAAVSDAFTTWGVTFGGGAFAVPRIRFRKVEVGIVPPMLPIPVLRNEGIFGSSANIPLVIDFKTPALRVGLSLSNGDSATRAVVKAFDPFGNLLGTIEKQGISGGDQFATVVEFEATASQGIGKVSIDYGSAPNAEELDLLRLDFVSSPNFTVFLAQVGDGKYSAPPLPGASAVRTMVVITSLAESLARAKVSFFKSDGSPQTLVVNGNAGSVFDFSLPRYGSQTFITSGSSIPMVSGYARIESNYPVQSVAIYQVVDSAGRVLLEAGVPAATGRVFASGVAQRFLVDEFDTGIALVNTTTSSATVEIRALGESGNQIGPPQILQLGPGQQTARFLAEFLPALGSADFKGSVLVGSSGPVAIVLIRTKKGLPVSSLPVGSTEK
ncbi:MAG TPA: hypothetical protein VGK99_23370 [Acidobacteriota bacterium]|jgi:hypothetical protein